MENDEKDKKELIENIEKAIDLVTKLLTHLTELAASQQSTIVKLWASQTATWLVLIYIVWFK
jgi:hypothetical protein